MSQPSGAGNTEYRHGYGVHPLCREYRAWLEAKSRCYNPNRVTYRNHGGRGITMAQIWREDFCAFLRDLGPCPPGHSLDRIDNDGPYAPGNCRWATAAEQSRNQRRNVRLTIRGETLCVTDWARRASMSPYTIYWWISTSRKSIPQIEAELEVRIFGGGKEMNDTEAVEEREGFCARCGRDHIPLYKIWRRWRCANCLPAEPPPVVSEEVPQP